jgi:hypothetical protein
MSEGWFHGPTYPTTGRPPVFADMLPTSGPEQADASQERLTYALTAERDELRVALAAIRDDGCAAGGAVGAGACVDGDRDAEPCGACRAWLVLARSGDN